MKKIKSTSIAFLFIQIIALIVAAMIIWPLLDMFLCNVFTNSEFHYSVFEHVVEPIIFGVIAGIIFWIINIITEKRKAKN